MILFVFIVVKSVSKVVKVVCNPLVFAMVKAPSAMVGCFPFSAVSNPLVFAMVKSPSAMVGCFVPISVKRLVVLTKKELALILTPVISHVMEKSPCCEISPKTLVPTRVLLP